METISIDRRCPCNLLKCNLEYANVRGFSHFCEISTWLIRTPCAAQVTLTLRMQESTARFCLPQFEMCQLPIILSTYLFDCSLLFGAEKQGESTTVAVALLKRLLCTCLRIWFNFPYRPLIDWSSFVSCLLGVGARWGCSSDTIGKPPPLVYAWSLCWQTGCHLSAYASRLHFKYRLPKEGGREEGWRWLVVWSSCKWTLWWSRNQLFRWWWWWCCDHWCMSVISGYSTYWYVI